MTEKQWRSHKRKQLRLVEQALKDLCRGAAFMPCSYDLIVLRNQFDDFCAKVRAAWRHK